MEKHGMTIWRDVPIAIWERGKRFWAEVPVVYFNTITNKIEEVVNNRGRAYALRKAAKYRRKKDKESNDNE